MIGGVAALVSALGGACTDDAPGPEGRIVVSWTIDVNGNEWSCADALLDRVRVTAIKPDDGELASSGDQPCADGSATVAVSGGTYLVSVDTLGADDEIHGRTEQRVVAASSGETPVSVVVLSTWPTGLLHARWSAPCPAQSSTIDLSARDGFAGIAPCTAGELVSDPVSAGPGTARLTWIRGDGALLGEARQPYEITARGQLVELAPVQF